MTATMDQRDGEGDEDGEDDDDNDGNGDRAGHVRDYQLPSD